MHLLWLFLLLWPSGYSTAWNEVTGPKTERGPERGSLTVQCNYTSKWKTHRKYWCKGAQWISCKILVITTGSEQEKKDRVSIRDDQKKLMFTVTMVDLRRDDAGFYWCGIERIGSDFGFQVNVIVDPAPSTVSTTAPTTSTCTTNTYAAPVPTENTNNLPTLTSHYSNSRHPFTELSTLLPLIFAVLLLLLMAASLLAWRMVRRQKKDAGLSPEQVPQSLEGDLCYANLSLQQPRSSPGSSRKNASTKTSSAQADQAKVEYVTMAPFPREDISYASLSLDVWDQEPTYSNTGHLPRRDQEEPTEYSSIRRP